MIIHADMFLRTWNELEYRQDSMCSTKGAHTEVYEGKLKTLREFCCKPQRGACVYFNLFKNRVVMKPRSNFVDTLYFSRLTLCVS